MSDERLFQPLCGWRGIDATQKLFAGQFSALRQAAPHLFGGPAPTDPVLLYKAWSDVLGKYPDYPAQQIGDCVSFGHGHGNDLLQCIEIGLGEPAEYRETDTEFIYAASREVAGILGTSDGSYGAAAVKAMTTIGLLSREMLGTDATYSGDRAKAWGADRAAARPRDQGGTLQTRIRRPGFNLGRPGGSDHQRLPRHDLHRPGLHADPRLRRLLRGKWNMGPLHAPGRCSLRPTWGMHYPELGARYARCDRDKRAA